MVLGHDSANQCGIIRWGASKINAPPSGTKRCQDSFLKRVLTPFVGAGIARPLRLDWGRPSLADSRGGGSQRCLRCAACDRPDVVWPRSATANGPTDNASSAVEGRRKIVMRKLTTLGAVGTVVVMLCSVSPAQVANRNRSRGAVPPAAAVPPAQEFWGGVPMMNRASTAAQGALMGIADTVRAAAQPR